MRLAIASIAAIAVAAAATAAVAACSTLTQDPQAPYDASPLGPGLRLAQVQNPASPDFPRGLDSGSSPSVDLSSIVVTWLDTYDETHDGKSVGTLYVQDVGSTAPFAGIGVYEPNYVPASLNPLPGDVLDFTGPYTEETSIGSAMFDMGTYLPQLSKPVGTYRYDFVPPPPVVLTPADLDGSDKNFANARQWMGMLVTVKDVFVAAGESEGAGNGARVTYALSSDDAGATALPVSIDNELYDLPCAPAPSCTQYPASTHFASVTGILTWFFSYHIAPRSPADLAQDLDQ
jgi:hypothetical protein